MKRRRSGRPEIPTTWAWTKRAFFSVVEYNSRGALTRKTDPLGRETVYTYDPNEIDLLNIKQKNGANYDLLASYAYKQTPGSGCSAGPAHSACKLTDAAGQVTTLTYNTDGTLGAVVTPPRSGLSAADRTTTYDYFPDNAPNGAGRIETVTAPLGTTIGYTYDGYGRVRTMTTPDNFTRTYDYDVLDRQTKTTYPDSTFEEWVYNRLNAEKHRDRLGRWSYAFYDALGRIATVRDPQGRTITQNWCTCGSLDRLTDSNGNTTTWQRDVQARVTKEIRANASEWLYAYENTTSRTKSVTDPKGQTTNYSYFTDDRLKQITYSDAAYTTPGLTFTYDAAYPRIVSRVDAAGTTAFSYNAITSSPAIGARRVASVDGPGTSDTITYSYDEMGRQVGRTIDGVTTTFAYDAIDRLATVTHPVGTFTYAYVGSTGRRSSLTYPNGTVATYAYASSPSDPHLEEIHHKFSGGATLSKQSYTHDVADNITTWQQQDESSAATIYELGYDGVDQLASGVYRTTGGSPTILKRYGYAYDLAGNRTTLQIDDAPLQSTYNNMNRLTSQQPAGALRFAGSTSEAAAVTVQSKPATTTSSSTFSGSADVGSGTSIVTVTATDAANNVRTNDYQVSISGSSKSYTYDNNGNLTQKVDGADTWGYEWFANDLLARVTKNSVEQARFVYDGDDRRYQKIAGGITTTYTYDGDNVLREAASSGTTYRYVLADSIDEVLARQDQAGSANFYHADHLGSIVKMTNASGSAVETRRYDPFGNIEGGSATAGYAFTGREWTPEVQLYYYRARYYSSDLGRFISEDPIGFKGGNNWYAYVGNNPVNYRDPFGLFMDPTSRDAISNITHADGKCISKVLDPWPLGRAERQGWRYAHCMSACQLVKECGKTITEVRFLGWVNEKKQVIECRVLGIEDACETADADRDYKDNRQGYTCPQGVTCKDRCQEQYKQNKTPQEYGPHYRGPR